MAMVRLILPCNTNLSQTLSLEDSNLDDASFSSDLNGAEGTLVLKLAKSSRNLDSLITTTDEHFYLLKERVEDGEIGVFDAEKYFNGALDENNPRIDNMGAMRHRYEKDEAVDICPVKTKTQLGTPSVHSESNWNSQSAFLHFVQRNSPQRKKSRLYGKSLLACLRCSCSCIDKNSVDVCEHVGGDSSSEHVGCGVVKSKTTIRTDIDSVDLARTNKSRLDPCVNEGMHCKNFDELGLGLNKKDSFRFPILNSKKGKRAVRIQLQEKEDDKPRKSLEVFGSPVLQKGKKTTSHDRKLTMLTWDAIPSVEGTETSASYDGVHNSITESDSSSDLFELDSFTNNANTFLTSQASEGMSSCVTPTTCYDHPSEASIAWSVVTASATDFSVMSNSWELGTIATTSSPNKMIPTGKSARPNKQIQKQFHSLLGCKNHKAVTVAGYAHTSEKAIPDPRRHRMDSFVP